MHLGRICTEWQRGGYDLRHVTREALLKNGGNTNRPLSHAAASGQGNIVTCGPEVSEMTAVCAHLMEVEVDTGLDSSKKARTERPLE